MVQSTILTQPFRLTISPLKKYAKRQTFQDIEIKCRQQTEMSYAPQVIPVDSLAQSPAFSIHDNVKHYLD